MPVEIKELIIRAIVADDGNDPTKGAAGAAPEIDREALVQECVRQVMKILETAKER